MASRFPFTSFPDGWYMVARSADLAPGSVLPLNYFGQELVLFRTESGTAGVFDAYCPHLGTHLGLGGKVRGETLQCPLHGWRFDNQGTCVEIPFAKKVPPKARAKAWPICERNGVLMIYHHHDGAAPVNDVPLIPELSSAEWTPPRRHQRRMRTHLQEIPENVVDLAHTRFFHGMDEELKVMQFEPDGEVLRFQLEGRTTRMDAELYGLGLQLYRFRTDLGDGGVEFVHVIMCTPIDEEHIEWRLLHSLKGERDSARTRQLEDTIARYVDSGTTDDVTIFETRAYVSTPILADCDGPIMAFRRWAQQFYG